MIPHDEPTLLELMFARFENEPEPDIKTTLKCIAGALGLFVLVNIYIFGLAVVC